MLKSSALEDHSLTSELLLFYTSSKLKFYTSLLKDVQVQYKQFKRFEFFSIVLFSDGHRLFLRQISTDFLLLLRFQNRWRQRSKDFLNST